MHSRRPLLAILIVVLFVFRLQSATGPDFRALRKAWILSLESRDLDNSLALYDHDATFLNPDGTHVSGEALRKLFTEVFKNFQATITLSPRVSNFSGELAYESGSYDETITAIFNGKRQHLAGDYVTIYRHSGADQWLIMQHVWTEIPVK